MFPDFSAPLLTKQKRRYCHQRVPRSKMSSEKANAGDVARALQMLKESNKKMITRIVALNILSTLRRADFHPLFL